MNQRVHKDTYLQHSFMLQMPSGTVLAPFFRKPACDKAGIPNSSGGVSEDRFKKLAQIACVFF